MTQKKFMGWLLSTAMLLNVLMFMNPTTTEANVPTNPFAGGTGTVSDPYIVTTPEQLQAMNDYLSGHFKLGNDIDLSGYLSKNGEGYNDGEGWNPIGSEISYFSGTFDGDGHTISNLKIYRESGRAVGLFGMTVPEAIIKNVGLTNVDVQAHMWVGGLVGQTVGTTIQQVYVTGSVSGMPDEETGGSIGGIVGQSNFSTIENSYMIGQVKGRDSIGGIFGNASGSGNGNTILTNSYTVSTIQVENNGEKGAIAPSTAALSFENSYYNSETYIDDNEKYGESKTTEDMKLQEIYENWNFDTIWGIDPTINDGYPYLKAPQIPQDFADGDGTEMSPYQIENAEQLNNVRNYPDKQFLVIKDIDLGIAPYNTGEGWEPIGSYEENQPFTGTFNGNGKVIRGLYVNTDRQGAGLFGYTRNAAILNVVLDQANVEVTSGQTDQEDLAGALVGYAQDTSIVHSSSSGVVSGTKVVGGLIGKIAGGTSVRTSSSSAVVVVTYFAGGGLVGESTDLNGSPGHPIIIWSYATGNVGAVNNDGKGIGSMVGGFIGKAMNTTIKNSYATGNVTAWQQAGGFAGGTMGSLISESYSGPSTVKADYSGGFIYFAMNSTLTNNYSRTNVSGEFSTAGFIIEGGGSNQISHAYATGNTGTYGFGKTGVTPPSSVTDSVYYDKDSSDFIVKKDELGKAYSNLEMKSEKTYAGWDFTAVWTFQKDHNNDYPLFQWQLQPWPASELHAPAGLEATAGSGKVDLEWESAVGAERYLIFMSTASGKMGNFVGMISAEEGATQRYSVSELTNGTTYYFVVLSLNSWMMMEKSLQVSAVPVSSSTGGDTGNGGNTGGDTGSGGNTGSNTGGSTGGNNTSGTPSQPSTGVSGVDVLVNGKAEKAGTATDSKRKDQTVTAIEVDQKKLDAKLAAEGKGAIVTIPVSSKSDIIVGELNGQMVKNMENQQAVLKLQTERAAYTLPAAQINIDAISKELGQVADLKEVKVKIELAVPEAEMIRVVESSAGKGTFSLVAPPVEFRVQASFGDKTVEIEKFNAYVERTIALPDDVDPSKITTGVVVDPDGTVRHVPTHVIQVDGKYYAVINSLTNSTYSVVWHPREFADMTSHWAKDAVNDMGSRMVIEGTGDGTFSPDRNITRAEFAAIVVRGLGLKPDSYSASFNDVRGTEWFSSSVQTAYAYDLIQGFEDGTFRPNDQITREQAMAIIAKAMKITALSSKLQAKGDALLLPYLDAEKVSAWARNSTGECLEAGIITGRSGVLLAPKSEMTRAEVATIVKRLLQQSGLI